ncbi:MAG: hypothetical protein ACRD96_08425, partial [Bryobacteraceae bacterium]
MMRAVYLIAAATALAAPRVDPRLISVHPFTGPAGGSVVVTARGNGLREATAAFLEKDPPFTMKILATETEPAPQGRNRTPADLVRIQLDVNAGARAGRYMFRLVTPQGISNALPVY